MSDSGRFIGIDVGGTKVSIAALERGAFSEPLLRPTATDSTRALLDAITAQARTVMADGPAPTAVGVGIPSVVDFAAGRARASVNIPLADTPLRDDLSQRLGVPVFVDNDANCAALAEAHNDAGEIDTDSLVMLTVGTGVGGGIVIGGRIYRGATGAAAELGHTLIGARLDPGPPAHSDRAPQPGSLESLAAGRALDRIAHDLGLTDGPTLVKAAQAGDQAARGGLAELATRLGIGIANAINTFDPDVVAIGGGVSAAGELLLEPARAAAARYVLAGVGTRTEIRIARSGPRAGVRGAALLARAESTASRPPR